MATPAIEQRIILALHFSACAALKAERVRTLFFRERPSSFLRAVAQEEVSDSATPSTGYSRAAPPG
jgi:hypothetical protein